MPLCDPREFSRLVLALGGPPLAAERLRRSVAWVQARMEGQAPLPLWALVLLRRARFERDHPPVGAA